MKKLSILGITFKQKICAISADFKVDGGKLRMMKMLQGGISVSREKKKMKELGNMNGKTSMKVVRNGAISPKCRLRKGTRRQTPIPSRSVVLNLNAVTSLGASALNGLGIDNDCEGDKGFDKLCQAISR